MKPTGKFQALLTVETQSCNLENGPQNATYCSKTIENKIIKTDGSFIISKISKEIKEIKLVTAIEKQWKFDESTMCCCLTFSADVETNNLNLNLNFSIRNHKCLKRSNYEFASKFKFILTNIKLFKRKSYQENCIYSK